MMWRLMLLLPILLFCCCVDVVLMLLSLLLLHAALTAAIAGAGATSAILRPCHLHDLVTQGQITPFFGNTLWEGEPKSGSIPGNFFPITWTGVLGDGDSVYDVVPSTLLATGNLV